MDEESEQLGHLIRRWREETPAYRSLRRFADVLGKSPSWLSKVERNLEIPGDETLIAIADLLQRDVDILFQAARRLHPEVEEPLAERYSEVAGLLRTIRDMTPSQVVELTVQAKTIKERSEP